MLSRLDSIFKTEIRQTEQTDTRQAIQRREPDQHRRNTEDENTNSAGELWHDDISVSVQSVKNILEQLLHKPAMDFQESANAKQDATQQTSGSAANNTPPTGTSDKAARAAQAYQRTWEAVHPEDNVFKPTRENLPEISLSGNETRMINELIKNLGILLNNGIETLTLEKSDSFLNALHEAVDTKMRDILS